MKLAHAAMLIAMTALTGCASPEGPMPLRLDHPAHPEAASTPSYPPSEILSIADGDRPGEDRADTEAEAMNHGGHGGMDHDNGEAQSDAGAGVDAEPGLYVCPMHPEVTSHDPDARCPKCGMALERKEHLNEQ